MTTNVLFSPCRQHETSEKIHAVFAKGHDSASMVVQLRCHWLWHALLATQATDASVGILHSARCHSVPEACRLPFQHVHSRYPNDCCLLSIVVHIVAVLEGIIWESKFFPSKALFKLHSMFVDLLIIQCGHCAVCPPKPACPFHAEDLVYEDVERAICQWHETAWKQFGDRISFRGVEQNSPQAAKWAPATWTSVGSDGTCYVAGGEKMTCPAHTPVSSNGKLN